MVMRGKGGFLRVVEAVIAILLIGGVMAFIYVTQIQGQDAEEEANRNLRILLNEIESNQELRNYVLEENKRLIDEKIRGILPAHYGFKSRICELEEICGVVIDETDGAVYSNKVSVSVTLDSSDFDPKKIRIFIWER